MKLGAWLAALLLAATGAAAAEFGINADPAFSLDATFAPIPALPGHVGFASQSGALGMAILNAAAELGIGFTQFVSMGNKADVSGNDLLEFWEHDPDIRVILFYLESLGRPGRFMQIARRVARRKPIVVVKSGRTEAGTRAASSHTGSLAGMHVAVDALFGQAGVIRTDTIEELFDLALLLANQPVPAGDRVAILTNAGPIVPAPSGGRIQWLRRTTSRPALPRPVGRP